MEHNYSLVEAPETIKALLSEIQRTIFRDSKLAIELCDKAIELATGIGLTDQAGVAYSYRAQANQRLSELDRALLDAQTALDIFEHNDESRTLPNANGLSHANRIIGTIYADMGRYDVARK